MKYTYKYCAESNFIYFYLRKMQRIKIKFYTLINETFMQWSLRNVILIKVNDLDFYKYIYK